MYQAPPGRPRSSPPGDLFHPTPSFGIVYEKTGTQQPEPNTVTLAERAPMSEARRKAISAGLIQRSKANRRRAAAEAKRLTKADPARIWLTAQAYERIFGVQGYGTQHAERKGYEVKRLFGSGSWSSPIIAVPRAKMPVKVAQESPARQFFDRREYERNAADAQTNVAAVPLNLQLDRPPLTYWDEPNEPLPWWRRLWHWISERVS